MLVSDTLGDVREFLNDQDKDRYSDAYLLKLYNEGLLDLSKRLRLFKSEASIPIVQGQSIYSLPLDFIEFDDISLNGETPLDFASRTQVQQLGGKNWRQKEVDGPPTHLIYNKQTFYQFRVYPVPTGPSINELYDIDVYGFPSDIEDVESVDVYGIFSTLEDSISAILFDPAKVNSDLDQISSQVSFLAAQVSQYSSAISANAVAIQQVYGIASSAQLAAQGAQLAASGAVTTVNDLQITVDTLDTNTTNSLGTINTTITTLASQLTTVSATASTALSNANAAGTAASAAQATATSASTTANTAQSRLNNVDGANKSIETLATSVTTVTSTANSALSAAGTAGTLAGTANNTAASALSVANSTKARIDSISGGSSIESLATQVTSLTASVSTANANASSAVTVANNASAAVTGLNTGLNSVTATVAAQASQITTLNATVGSHTSTLTIHSSAIAALESTTASWEVVTNVNSLTNGFGIYNNGSYEEVVFRTNNFKVYPNSGILNPFSFAIEGGKVVIPNAMITNIIQSDNFVTGVQGWQIRKDTAAAEFYSVTARGNIQATSLNAATGTFSGTLTAAAVNAVNTINIADQSVVLDTSFFDASSVSFGQTAPLSSAFVTVATKSITMVNATSSSTINITTSLDVTTEGGTFASNPGYDLRILRDGTPIYTKTISKYESGDSLDQYSYSFYLDWIDSPGAGTFNYQIQIRATAGNPSFRSCINRYLRLSGGKK